MRRLAWTFAARIGDKYQIHLTRSISYVLYRTAVATVYHEVWPQIMQFMNEMILHERSVLFLFAF